MSDFKKNRKEEIDEFWDISRLVPAKAKSKPATPTPIKKTTPVEISISTANATAKNEEEQKITALHTFSKPAEKEEPPIYATHLNFSPFISRITVENWKSTYNYYEFFCRQAAALYNKRGEQCPEAHFFSYVAQYSQLNRRQLDWYLWWRECIRKGIYLGVDISYIYLLVFEIINLGETIDTKKSLDTLIGLWRHYKDTYPQLTAVLGDWICDYSLIHNLPITFPDNRIDREMIDSVHLKEALLSFDPTNHTLLCQFIMSFCNAYNYRKSKFYSQETKEMYDTHLPAALEYFLQRTEIEKLLGNQPQKHLSIVSYTGALCSYKIRKHIEVDYLSFCDSHELKSLVGDIVKYAENKLRSFLGIRSRLTVSLKNEKIKACIDSYFSQTLSVHNHSFTPEYEKLYDVKENAFSIDSALNIERQSWDVTEKLVEAFEEEEDIAPVPMPPQEVVTPQIKTPSIPEPLSEKEQFLNSISAHLVFFNAILQENASEQCRYAKEKRLMAEAIVDEINESAVDILGDIVIEEADDGFRIIEDYQGIFENND